MIYGVIASSTTFSPLAQVVRLIIGNGSSPSLYNYKGSSVESLSFVETYTSGGAGYCAEPTSDGVYILLGLAASPYARLLKRNGDNYSVVFSFSDLSATVYAASWSADGMTLYLATNSTIRKYARTGDSLSFVSASASIAGGFTGSCALSLHPSGSYVACAHVGSPYISVFKTSDWTKLTNPATLPPGQADGCSWSPSGNHLVVTLNAYPRFYVYSFDAEALAKLTDPASLPSGSRRGVAWGGDNSWFAICGDKSPFWDIYTLSGSTLTRVNTSSFALAGAGYGIDITGEYIVCGHTSGNKVSAFNYSSGVISKVSLSLGTNPGFSGFSVAIVETD